jgi:L-iditol 2-dehydrogenase
MIPVDMRGKNMKQAKLVTPKEIIMQDVDSPRASENQVLIKVAYNGICGSDIHAYYGKHPFISCPITLGHEFSGLVTEIGNSVSNIKAGDRVTVMPQIFCGRCEPCKEGRYNICETLAVIGCQTPGAASAYFACDAHLVKKVPDNMSFKIASTIEPAAVGIHAVRRTNVKGKNILVLGAGTIGNLTAQAAVAEGAKNVIIADLSESRLEIAKKCGLKNAVLNIDNNLEKTMTSIFGDSHCDVAFECVGIGPTVNQAIKMTKKGKDIVIVGVFGKMAEVDMALVQDKELCLLGSLMYIESDYDDVMKYMAESVINTEPLITKVFDFDEYIQAYKYIESQRDNTMKVMIRINKDLD